MASLNKFGEAVRILMSGLLDVPTVPTEVFLDFSQSLANSVLVPEDRQRLLSTHFILYGIIILPMDPELVRLALINQI